MKIFSASLLKETLLSFGSYLLIPPPIGAISIFGNEKEQMEMSKGNITKPLKLNWKFLSFKMFKTNANDITRLLYTTI